MTPLAALARLCKAALVPKLNLRFKQTALLCVRSAKVFHHMQRCYRMYSSPVTPVFMKQLEEADFLSGKPLIIDDVGEYSYFQILEQSFHLSVQLKKQFNVRRGDRVAIMCPNNSSYTVVQWGVWMAGGVAVPLCISHPPPQLQEVIQDCDASVVVATSDFASVLDPLCSAEKVRPLWLLYNQQDRGFVASASHLLDTDRPLISLINSAYQNSWRKTNWANHDAMLIYTSGTTGKPKGVAVTHANLIAQVENMLDAWEWTDDDVILHTLPLHHVHGITNCLAVPLYCGATCVMMPKFSAGQVWEKLLSDQHPRINVFMAVPTIYAKLIEYYNQTYTSPKVRDFIRGFCKENIRLMVSGSAALPAPVMEKWEEITGHVLLERYGMSEVGMALTNSLHGPRIPGAVGNPFPTVELQITDQDGTVLAAGSGANGTMVTQGMEDKEGELYVRGPSVFAKYWRQPAITKQSFTPDGWFKTGDTAVYRDGVYRILGRDVDIIKSGGYKISALEVERHLLANGKIQECIIFGLPDNMWGERVAAVVVLHRGESLGLQELKSWAADKLAHYKIPSVLECVDEIPRNAMGKVNKKQVRTLIFPPESQNTQPYL